jgi:16S rRNA processing protein RimM
MTAANDPSSAQNTERDPDGPETLWLEVGTIGKPHGLKGEVVVDFVTDRLEERTALGAELRLGPRTLVVAKARPHQKKWLVQFEGVTDRNGAERLRGGVLEAEAIDDPEALFVHDLIDKVVVDQHGTRHGTIVSVVENPASDLLELGDGRLIPLVFVAEASADSDSADPDSADPDSADPDSADPDSADPDSADSDPDVVRVEVPPGLLDGDLT